MTKNNEIKEKVLEELKKLGLIKYIDEKIMSTTKYQVFLAEKVIDLTIKQFEQKEQEYKKLIWEATIVKDNDYKDKLDRIKTLEQQIESLKENKITKEWNYKGVNVGLTNSWFDDKEKFAVYYKEDLVPILDVLILSKKLQEENQQLKKEIERLNEEMEFLRTHKNQELNQLKSQLQEQRNKIEDKINFHKNDECPCVSVTECRDRLEELKSLLVDKNG
jgi:hypothetical protein